MRRALATLFATTAAITLVVTPIAADALPLQTLSVVTSVGTDISYPQCGTDPATSAFTIVGVNDGLPNAKNPCLAEQLAWASLQGQAELYVNTANPGVHLATWWPRDGRTQHGSSTVRTPYGTCAHTITRACAYVYGYSMARDDLTRWDIGDASSYRWWLDVETGGPTGNTWVGSAAVNRADLEGMVAAFRAAGAAVGIYSTHQQFAEVAGAVPATSHLAGLQTWLSASETPAGARAQCATKPLTPGGRVVLAQYTPLGSLDQDIRCPALATSKPTIAGVAAPRHRLTAHAGIWTAGTVLTYRWRRSGHDIAGATQSTYTPSSHDLHHAVTVRVTGRLIGYSLTSRTSATVTVGTALSRTPTPTVSGSASVGHELTAHPGVWRPVHVTLRYQWRRNGVAIAGATHQHHTVTAADAGTTLTVSVRASKHGSATVTRTSSGRLIATTG